MLPQRLRVLAFLLPAAVGFGFIWWYLERQLVIPTANLDLGNLPTLKAAVGAGNQPNAVSLSPARRYDATLEQALAMPDLAAAIRFILAEQDQDHCADTRLVCLIESLPVARLAELASILPLFRGNAFVTEWVGKTWAARDPAAALAWAESSTGQRTVALAAVLEGWARGDAAAAQKWLDSQPENALTQKLRMTFLSAKSETDPAAAWALVQDRDWAFKMPNSLTRILANWATKDPAAALAAYRAFSKNHWSEESIAALPAYSRYSRTNGHTTLLGAIVSGLMAGHPAEAAAFTALLSDEENRIGGDALANEVWPRSPETLFERMRTGFLAPELLSNISEKDPDLILQGLKHLPDPTVAETAIKRIANSSEITRPEVREQITAWQASLPEDRRGKAAGGLATGAARLQPTWALELWPQVTAADRERSGAYFFKNLSEGSPEQARSFFFSLPEAEQASALRGLCAGLASKDPEGAWELALMQEHPDLRTEAAAAVLTFAKQGQDLLARDAAKLDLAALRQSLPQATNFSSFQSGVRFSENTKAVTALLQTLLPPAKQP